MTTSVRDGSHGFLDEGIPSREASSHLSVTCVVPLLRPRASAERCRRREKSERVLLLAKKDILLQVRALLVASHGTGGYPWP